MALEELTGTFEEGGVTHNGTVPLRDVKGGCSCQGQEEGNRGGSSCQLA